MSQKTAIVIGGGIAGLSSAALLAKAGMKVQLFEARESLGGRAYLWEKDGFRFDMGPSWYLMSDAFEQFFRLMGTSAENELKLEKINTYSDDYARTLATWRKNFLDAWEKISPLGFDEYFKRMWEFYLSYCEGGFKSRNINLIQFSMSNRYSS